MQKRKKYHGLSIRISRCWVDADNPFFQAAPDAVLVAEDGTVMGIIELKTHSQNNYVGRSADDQVKGQALIVGAQIALLVTQLKKSGVGAKVTDLSESGEALVLGNLMIGYLLHKFRRNQTDKKIVEKSLRKNGFNWAFKILQESPLDKEKCLKNGHKNIS